MASFLQDLLDDKPGRTGTKVIAIFGLLVIVNLAAWAWALTAFHHYPVPLGTAFLAHSFGLGHAVDADQIAAIDNATRKLMQEGKRSLAVGLMFSLGAYGWAFVKPIRKIYYNITITLVSITVAFAIGGIDALWLLLGRFT